MKKYLPACLLLLAAPAMAQQADTTLISAEDSAYLTLPVHKAVKELPPQITLLSAGEITGVLDGLVTGVQQAGRTGQPGSAPSLLIRGLGSLSENAAPLVLLNNMPYTGDITLLNTNDIASITVLKDAAETAEYGSRGANGVIQIVTRKRCDNSGSHLTLNARSGIITSGVREYKKLDPKAYYETVYDLTKGIVPPDQIVDQVLGGYNAYNVPNDQLFTTDGKVNPNASLRYHDSWQKQTRRLGSKQDYQLAFSNEGKLGILYVSSGYLKENGLIKSTGFERWTGMVNGILRPKPWLRAGINANGAIGSQHSIVPGDSYLNPIYAARMMPSIYPVYVYDAAGNRETDPLTGDRYDWGADRRPFANSNAAGAQLLDAWRNRSSSWVLNPYISATVLKQFTLEAVFQYDVESDKTLQDQNPYFGRAAALGGFIVRSDLKQQAYNFHTSLGWDRYLGQHYLQLKTGYEYYRQTRDFDSSFAAGSDPLFRGQSYFFQEHKLSGVYIKGNYEFKEKYLLSAVFRRDQTTNLFPGARDRNYWSVGAAYRIDKENFMKNSWLRGLKLHASYGLQGNAGLDQPIPFIVFSPLSSRTFRQANAGISLMTYSNRFSVDLDAYSRQSTADPVFMPLNNKGLELAATASILRNVSFNWEVHLTATHNRNSIAKMPPNTPQTIDNFYRAVQGQSAYDFYLPQYAGVDPVSGRPLYYKNAAAGGQTPTPDYISLVGVDDWRGEGSAFPYLYGGLSNNFRYKQFELYLQLNYSLGGKCYDIGYAELMGDGINGYSWSTDILDRWTPDHPSATIPGIRPDDLFINAPSDRFIRSASYLSIRQVYLAYQFETKTLKKAHLKSLTLYLSGENLWLFSAVRGMNPQASFAGVDNYTYPIVRTVMFGVKAGL
ncbi:TonB-dependent receptor plug domain-containing protein [Taibaiella koreensis]|uniref:TonB-dependent receptor plug domain-containing protein n=1 Tax=Taibaiella koreensis TaxID=1268548 RepID=UPI000E599F54|nr:TonB-dependent receptor plug domain-containing protein [Taibaiella koreensis]